MNELIYETKTLKEELLRKVLERFSPEEFDFIKRALEFAEEMHKGQKRMNGEDYINHPIRTALNLISLYLDKETISAALLHDILEDTNVSLEYLESLFGKEVSFIVDGVTKITSIKYQNKTIKELQKLSKFLIYLLDDLRVLFVKLSDRLDNMRTLDFLPEEKRIKVAQETKEIYLPFAQKLGFYLWASELDELCFKHLYPDKYKFIKEYIKEKISQGEEILRDVKERIIKEMTKHGIVPVKVEYRVKKISSIWKKYKKKKDLDKIYDIFALRIIVKKVEECYLVLGVVHKIFRPIFEEFDDYIAFPKQNGYQSIHTTVVDKNGQFIEIQIRTEEMHLYNEIGPAAYFGYSQFKDTKDYLKGKSVIVSESDLKIIEKLRKWQEIKNPKEFLSLIKEEFFQEKILVYTPKGDIVDLVKGATCVDFAYEIHTEIGNHCAGAIVNGRIVSLDTELRNGDVVEIIVNKNKFPSRDWLSFVKTYKARRAIRKFFNETKKSS